MRHCRAKDTLYLEKIINNLSIKYDSPKFIPHITIHGLVNLKYSIIEKSVKNSIQKIKPFIVKKIEIKHEEDIWKSLFIDIEKNKELILINKKLNHSFNIVNINDFLPHISLIYKNLNKIEKSKIIENLKIKNEFKIDKIVIQKFSKNVNEWKIVQTFNL